MGVSPRGLKENHYNHFFRFDLILNTPFSYTYVDGTETKSVEQGRHEEAACEAVESGERAGRS